MRYLINKDGNPFDPKELKILYSELEVLSDDERKSYRNENASAIAGNEAEKFLIVSGPGTGKSYLFLDRINRWYKKDSEAKVFVTSFVRKLVADLQKDIDGDTNLSGKQKKNISVSTLHKFARSIVEKNHGTFDWKFKPYFQIIVGLWEEVIWRDVVTLVSSNKDMYAWKDFCKQLHDNNFLQAGEWPKLKKAYFEVCKFYNVASFADLILRATEALVQNYELDGNNYFIVDEYQDFNRSENEFINQLTVGSKGLLIVGDDEQVLYEELKSGNPELIRATYKEPEYINGMLPFCGRSSFHIVKTAGYFIKNCREDKCIEKIYLPLENNDGKPKVKIIGCASPSGAIDYIENFVLENKVKIEERKNKLASGEEKDAFLLILSLTGRLDFYGDSKEKIEKILKNYQTPDYKFSEDYYKILDYYSFAKDKENNFYFRKIIHHEDIPEVIINKLIRIAISRGLDLCDFRVKETELLIEKSIKVKDIIDNGTMTPEEKAEEISHYISINKDLFIKDVIQESIGIKKILEVEKEGEEVAELEEIGIKRMGAIELISMVGSKGLSADHVIIVGFDNVNMSHATQNAFYVAMTRARESLHIITALKSKGAKEASKFLDQLPTDHLEFYYKKAGQKEERLTNKQEYKEKLRSLNKLFSFFKKKKKSI